MKVINLALVFAALGLVLPASASAQILTDKFYFKGDVGANWVKDTDLKEFLGTRMEGTTIEFDPGPRVGVGFGYHVTDWFAAEAEVGFMANSISKISNAQKTDAVFGQSPFLINARLDIPTGCRFTPYIGVGGGGSAMWLDIDEIEIDGSGVWGTGGSVVWAYQAFAGLNYQISENVRLGLEFRYFGAGEPNFGEADDHYYHDQESLRFGRVEGYAASLAVTVRF